MAKSIYQTRYEDLQKQFELYKQSIPDIMQSCIDEYQLDLCEDGVADFCKRINVDPPATEKDVSATVYLNGFSMKASKGSYGWEFDDDAVYKLQTEIDEALKPLRDKYEGMYVELDNVEMA